MAKKTQESMAAQLRVARAEIERLRSRLDQQSQTAEAMYASLREWKRQISEFYANLSGSNSDRLDLESPKAVGVALVDALFELRQENQKKVTTERHMTQVAELEKAKKHLGEIITEALRQEN